MTRNRLTVIAFVLALCGLYSLPVLAGDAGQTIATACSKCHNTQRVCANLGVKDKAAWEATVTRMMAKGAAVSAQEKPGVVEWLASQKAGAKPVCQ